MSRPEPVRERLVVTASEQGRIDRSALEYGVAEDTLMESAGRGAAEWIREHVHLHRAVILVGPGGNGGDGLVVARYLLEAGIEVETLLFTERETLAPTTQTMLDRLTEAGGFTRPAGDAQPLDSLLDAPETVVIDALFGSGLSRRLEAPYADAVEAVNRSSAWTISIDLPSGIDSDAGELLGPAIRADVTLAMEFLKPGHLLYPAAGLCGSIAVVRVAYPQACLESVATIGRVLEPRGAGKRLPPRLPQGHKGTFGRVLLVAGSLGMTGAAVLACQGALRAGAGLVKLLVPSSLNPIFEGSLPEVITSPVREANGHLIRESLDGQEELLEEADVVAVGPGLSRFAGTLELVARLIESFDGPMVVDADALFGIAQQPALLDRLGGRAIITPHPGELARLVDRPAAEVDRHRRTIAHDMAVDRHVVVLLKGRPTVIGCPDGSVYFNPTGNTGLATGGSGDVLTGILAGLLAGGATAEDAAVAGAYAHGLAAEIYAEKHAERSLLPSDVLHLLPRAFRMLEG